MNDKLLDLGVLKEQIDMYIVNHPDCWRDATYRIYERDGHIVLDISCDEDRNYRTIYNLD